MKNVDIEVQAFQLLKKRPMRDTIKSFAVVKENSAEFMAMFKSGEPVFKSGEPMFKSGEPIAIYQLLTPMFVKMSTLKYRPLRNCSALSGQWS